MEKIAQALKRKGFRVTKPRAHLLALLLRAGKPLSVQEIRGRWRTDAPDQATLYRSLNDLTDAGVVRKVDLRTGVAYFEYAPDRPHHHHIMCTRCGAIEEVEICTAASLENQVLSTSAKFRSISSHTLEFFGMCNACTV